ncbi:MAG: threonine-phosphate decarboxylase CobD [Methylocystis sp.]|nr:threonine-phosphate decarboxylase CobD [Methylocystis sp.]
MNAGQIVAQKRALHMVEHGGRLDAARKLYSQAPQPWIDLSTGVNPRAYPLPTLASNIFTHLPDEDAVAACREAARDAYNAPLAMEIVVGAGAQALIQVLPQTLPARHVAILGFTFAEHANVWSGAGARVERVAQLDALAPADIAVIVNPNNPDGRIVAPEDVVSLARRMSARDATLIVDESFMDFTPTQSVIPRALENVVVLRSFGKAYGLPGLRLGFAICAPQSASRFAQALGPWAVSGPALAVGARALADKAWREEAARLCARDAARLDDLLVKAKFEIMGGTSLFRLAACSRATELYAHFCAQGVLVRAFREKPGWLRFGLPRKEMEWRRLARALETFNG